MKDEGVPALTGRSARKHRAILEAATDIFLAKGYRDTSMDEVAAGSGVSKQTVYKHFSSKEALFIEIVERMALSTGDRVLATIARSDDGPTDIADVLYSYALRQLQEVLKPRLLQLRRVVIGEAGRFPELARSFYENGPQRAIDAIAGLLRDADSRGFLRIEDTDAAAAQFNWLLMGEPLNRAMFLADASIPSEDGMRRKARAAVRVMIAAYAVG